VEPIALVLAQPLHRHPGRGDVDGDRLSARDAVARAEAGERLCKALRQARRRAVDRAHEARLAHPHQDEGGGGVDQQASLALAHRCRDGEERRWLGTERERHGAAHGKESTQHAES